MKNSWGQEIKVGSIVYRGARQGNSSEYKIGEVVSLNPGKSPRVRWLFEQSGRWIDVGDQRYYYPCARKLKNSQGSPSADSLVLIDVDLETMEREADFFKNLPREAKFRDDEELHEALDSHQI